MPDNVCLIADGGLDSGSPDTAFVFVKAGIADGGGAVFFDRLCEIVPIVVDVLINVLGAVISDLMTPVVEVPLGRGVI